jgi:hypothetical protein
LAVICSIDRANAVVTVPVFTPMIPANLLGSALDICPEGAYQRIA